MDAVFVECFGDLKEPRVERTKKHLLSDWSNLDAFTVKVLCDSLVQHFTNNFVLSRAPGYHLF